MEKANPLQSAIPDTYLGDNSHEIDKDIFFHLGCSLTWQVLVVPLAQAEGGIEVKLTPVDQVSPST